MGEVKLWISTILAGCNLLILVFGALKVVRATQHGWDSREFRLKSLEEKIHSKEEWQSVITRVLTVEKEIIEFRAIFVNFAALSVQVQGLAQQINHMADRLERFLDRKPEDERHEAANPSSKIWK